jgi:hypothetical protein
LSEDSEELLTGREGNEAAQGWTQMVPASPVDIPEPESMTQAELDHFRRPVEADFPEPEVRDYIDGATGEETPSNQSVTPEQAAHDLGNIRAQERAIREQQSNADLAEALDTLHGREQPAQDQPPPESFEPQPELPPDTSAQDDAEIQRLLQNPVLRERVQKEYAQMSTMAEYTRQHYTNAAAQLSQHVDSLLITSFPELQPFLGNQAQMAGALKMLQEQNPSRWAELQNFTQRAAIVTEHAQQAQAEQRAVVQQRQQEEFQRYAQAEDAKAFANTSPEELKQIRNYLYEEGQRAGFSREQINQHWGNNVALRNAHVSELLADGVRYRLARQNIAAHRNNPIPRVQRPGVASDGPSDSGDYASLERQFRGKDLNPRQAADLLIAHRGRR